MRLLQVCNVGDICGGTAACAWTLTQASPMFRHWVLLRTTPTAQTRAAFGECELLSGISVPEAIDRSSAEIVILHNLSRTHLVQLPRKALTVQYVHSVIDPAPADLTLACSQWLVRKLAGRGVSEVQYQPVPRPPQAEENRCRALRTGLVIGRLCTPHVRKWPESLLPFYRRLARSFPEVQFEFVGCPAGLRSPLQAACQGGARFIDAGWQARSRLSSWDAMLYHHPGLTESFGRVAAEAMRGGCIPIVDARGGFVEQMTLRTGFLCHMAEEFECAVRTLQDPAVRFGMSRAAVAHADERFSPARFANDFLRRLRAV